MTVLLVIEHHVMGFGKRNLLARFEGHFEKLDDLPASLVLEPIQLINHAEFAVQIRGRNNGDENRGVLQLLLNLLLEMDTVLDTIVKQIGRASCRERV